MKNSFAKKFVKVSSWSRRASIGCVLAALCLGVFVGCDDSSSAGGDETETSALSSSAKVTEHLSSLGGEAEVTSSSSEKVTSSSNVIANPEGVKQSSSSLVDPISSSNFQGDKLSSSSSGKQSESSSSSAGKVESSSSSVIPSSSSRGFDWSVPKDAYLNPEIQYDSIIDERDGKVYKTVTIGDQVWMAENLNYADSVKTPSLKGKSWCYNNVAANCDVTGRLYTWAAAMDSVKTGCGYGSTCEIASANSTGSSTGSATLVQGICPTGWHLPSQAEWSALFTAVGGSGTAGKVLKSQSGWYSNGNGTDAFGFSALLAGLRYLDGFFYDVGNYAYFWSSTELNSYYAYYVDLYYIIVSARLGNNLKNYGFSVRCVKDSD